MSYLLEVCGRPKDKFIQFGKDLKDIPEKKHSDIAFPSILSEKFDGVWCIAFKDPWGDVELSSRTGKVYTSMKHLEESFKAVLGYNEGIIFEVYDPELDQPSISGQARDKKKQYPNLWAYCHDTVTLEEFRGVPLPDIEDTDFYEGNPPRTYEERQQALHKKLHDYTDIDSSKLFYVTQVKIYNATMAMNAASYIWSQGGEGVILRDPRAYYEGGKRNLSIVKIKQSITLDLEVLDVLEGKGKFSGMTGALVLKYKDGKTITVGSGFLDSERIAWFEDPKIIIGEIVEIRAMKESTKDVLRELTFKGIRFDKTKGDY